MGERQGLSWPLDPLETAYGLMGWAHDGTANKFYLCVFTTSGGWNTVELT